MRTPSIIFFLVLCACVTGSQPARARDDQLLREMAQQERWAGEALARRPTQDELDAVRAGDRVTVADVRKRWRRLVSAVERTTWIRDVSPEALRGAGGNAQAEQEVLSSFDRAARLRNDAFGSADEVARTLAESPAPSALSLDELRKALLATRNAQQSEQRLSAHPLRGSATDGHPGGPPLHRVASIPVPRPFVEATAVFLAGHPGQESALESWPSQLSEERAQVRAALAARESGAYGPGDSLEGGEAERAGSMADWSRELKVNGDVRKLIAGRGPPVSILLRPDSLFALRYHEKRPCGVDQCDSTVDYLFDASGKLVRDEVLTNGPASSYEKAVKPESAPPSPAPPQTD